MEASDRMLRDKATNVEIFFCSLNKIGSRQDSFEIRLRFMIYYNSDSATPRDSDQRRLQHRNTNQRQRCFQQRNTVCTKKEAVALLLPINHNVWDTLVDILVHAD